MSDRALYVETDHYRAASDAAPLRVLDGGARGGLFDPFDDLEAEVEAIGFEPDANAAEGGASTKALWKESGEVRMHFAADRSTSSGYPPNVALLSQFPESNGLPRRTESVETVPSTSIDDAVASGAMPAPDLIKLDIHSAEYEAILGATQTLPQVAVLVETWHSPIHAGQHLHGEVEVLLNRHHFFLFDHCRAAHWWHAVDGEPRTTDQARLVASESLFFNSFPEPERADRRKALAAIAIADLYSYTNYAVQLSRRFAEAGSLPADLQEEIERRLRVEPEPEAVPPPSKGGLRQRFGPLLGRLRRAKPPPPAEDSNRTQRLSRWA